MGDDNICNDCDARVDHKTTVLLLKQHNERIGSTEDMTFDIRTDISNLEGRVNVFIWIIGIVFFLLCSIAFYGAIQIDKFKDIYMDGTIEINKSISQLATTVELSSERINDVKRDIKDIKDGQ